MAAAKPKPKSLDAEVGARVRARREALSATHDDLVRELRRHGWAATGPALVAIEAGRRAVRLSEVLLLARVLNVAVAELLPDDDAEHLTRPPIRVRGRRVDRWADLAELHATMEFSAGPTRHAVVAGEAEHYAARRLGVPASEVVRCSLARWRRGLSDERDARAAERTPPAATKRQRATIRAHVTRELLAELRDDLQARR